MYPRKLSRTLSVLLVLVMLLSLFSASALAAPGALAITAQPQDVVAAAGGEASFSVTAGGGDGSYTYQWECGNAGGSWLDLQGQANPTLVLSGVTADMNNLQYRCEVTDGASDSVTSNVATLTVATAPVLSGQPQSVTVTTGSSVSFSVTAAVYAPPVAYQWQTSSDGGGHWTAIEGAAGAEYDLAAVTVNLSGWQYRCLVTDQNGSTTSDPATLTVTTEPSGGGGESGLPDLVVRNIEVKAPDVEAGATVSVAVALYNAGGAGTDAPFSVQLYDGAALVGETTASALQMSAGQELDFTWNPTQPGDHTLKAVADSGGEIAESDETNNELTKTSTVGGWGSIPILPSNTTTVNYSGIWQSPSGDIYALYRVNPGSGGYTQQVFRLNTADGTAEKIFEEKPTSSTHFGGDSQNLYFASSADIYKLDSSDNWSGPMPSDASGGSIKTFWTSPDGQAYAAGMSIYDDVSGDNQACFLKLNPNNGKWERMQTAEPEGQGINNCDVFGLWGTDPNNIYAAEDYGTISHYDGTVWSANLLPPDLGVDSQAFYSVWGPTKDEVYAVGSSGTILQYKDGTWTQQASGTTETLYSVTGTGAKDIYAFGLKGTILHYDGTGWTNLTSSLSGQTQPAIGSSYNMFSALTDSATGNIYAVGNQPSLLRHISGAQWADLTVDNIAVESGEPAKVTVTIRNKGKEDAPAGFQVKLSSDDPVAEEVQTVTQAVYAGGTQTVDFDWTLPADKASITLHALVDSENVVQETDEENNESSLTIPISTHTLTLAAANGSIQGAANGDTFPDGARVSLKAVPAGGYVFKEWQDGAGNVLGTANPFQVTLESDQTVTAVFEPVRNDLSVTSLTPKLLDGGGTPVFYQSRSDYTLQAIVANLGNVPAAPGTVLSLYEGDNPQPVGTATVDSALQPGGTQTVGIPWTPAGSGNITLKAKAAFADGTTDADAGNDSATLAVTVVPGVPLTVLATSGSGGNIGINDIAGASADALFAATDSTILRYVGGGVWSPCAGVAGQRFLKLWVDSESKAYALAETTKAVYSLYKYDGQFWQEIPDTQKDANNDFNGTHINAYWKSPDDVFYLAVGGTLYKYAAGAGSWSTETLPNPNATVTSLWGSSASDIYAAGNDALYHYDGTSWSADSSFSGGILWGTGKNDLYWYGATIRHYDGSGWETLPGTGLPGTADANVNSLYKDASGVLYAVCGNSLFQYAGGQWQAVAVSGMAAGYTPKAVYGPLADCLLVADQGGNIYYSGTALDIGGSDGPAPTAKTVSMEIIGQHTTIPWTTVTVDNFDMTPYLKAGLLDSDQPTVFHALVKVLQANGYDPRDFDHVLSISGGYASMILNENAQGMAGWMYAVNGWTPNYGASYYKLQQGDEIIWFYGGYGAVWKLNTLHADKSYVQAGDSVTFTLTNNYYADNPASGGTLQSTPVGNAVILVGGTSAGNTDAGGKLTYTFSRPGTYTVQDQSGQAAPLTITVLANPPGGTPVITTNAQDKTLTVTQYAFKASAADAGGNPVDLTIKINGKEAYSQSSATSYSVGLLKGANTLELYAKDGEGHEALKTCILNYIDGPDTTPPVITTSVTDKQTVSVSQYAFTAGAQDDRDGAVGVSVTYNGQTVTPDSQGVYTVTLTKKKTDPDPANTITVRAADQAGNAAVQTYTVYYDPAAAPPAAPQLAQSALARTDPYVLGLTEPSEWNLIALQQAGCPPASGDLSALTGTIGQYYAAVAQGTQVAKVTDYEKWIMAVDAAGGDPAAVAGHNLIQALCGFDDILDQGLNGPIFGLISLDSGGYSESAGAKNTRQSMLKELLSAQNSDGGWDLNASGASDADITAMALQALAPYRGQTVNGQKVEDAVNRALTWLQAKKEFDGSYRSANFGSVQGEDNCESTAQAVIALCANGIDPAGAAYNNANGSNPLTALLKFQLSDGSFCHTLAAGVSDPMATEQGHLALLAYVKAAAAGFALDGGQNSVYNLARTAETGSILFSVSGLKSGTVTSSAYTFAALARDRSSGAVLPLTVKLNGSIVSGSNGSYALTLAAGLNTILLSAVDSTGKQASQSYAVTYNSPGISPVLTTITVTFSLLGTDADGPNGTVNTLAGGNLMTWISPTQVTLNNGATVYDAFTQVLNADGYTYVGASSNYVSSITKPGGPTLAEFTNGKLSGWMYTVNGTHPNVGLKYCTLHNGDVIVWQYTDDYTKEEGSERWNSTPPVTPTTPTAGGNAGEISAEQLAQLRADNQPLKLHFDQLDLSLSPQALPDLATGKLSVKASVVTDSNVLTPFFQNHPGLTGVPKSYTITLAQESDTDTDSSDSSGTDGNSGNSSSGGDSDSQAQAQPITRLNGSMELRFTLGAEDLQGLDPSTLMVFRVEEDGTVTELPGVYDWASGTLTVSTDRLCQFFIMGREGIPTQRLAGADRYATAAAVSASGWTTSASVVLAGGENFPDALAAVPLAGLKGAPILLTEKDVLTPVTLTEIRRLQAKTIYLIGGPGVISPAVEAQLAKDYTVTRIYGGDRYQTAVKIGEQLRQGHSTDTAILATGLNYPDALSIAPFAGKLGYPILFTGAGGLNDETRAALLNWGIKKIYLLGGTGVISAETEGALRTMGLQTTRLAGSDRYQTSLAIAQAFADPAAPYPCACLATGENFPDALAGAALAAKEGGPVLLAGPDSATSALRNYLQTAAPKKLFFYGGEQILPDKLRYGLSLKASAGH